MFWRQKKSREQDLERELRLDLELEAAEQEEKGLSAEEARYAAQRAFGNVMSVKEEVRQMWGWSSLELLGQDVQYALRLSRKTPAVTSILIATLALGLGMNTSVFSVVNAVMVRGLAFKEPDRLISLWEEVARREPQQISTSGRTLGGNGEIRRMTVAPANLADYQKRSRSFIGLAGFALSPMNLTGSGTPERIWGERVTSDFFSLLGVEPSRGRSFLPEEDQPDASGTAIIADEFWQRRFGGDPSILGRVLNLDGHSYQIVGVLPKGFQSPNQFGLLDRIEFYIPAAYPRSLLANHGDHEIAVIGRLKPGVSLRTAQSELDAISNDLAKQYPQTNEGVRAVLAVLQDDIVRNVRTALLVLLAATGLIVLIACVNVANLLLVRSIARRHETSVRLALGASRSRIVRQFLVESLLIALGGCGAGMLLGILITRLMISIAPPSIPRLDSIQIDWRVFLVSTIVAVTTGLVFGIIPAWQASRARPAESLKSTPRNGGDTSQLRWGALLTITEIALSMILLVGSGLLLKSFVRVLGVDLGFQPEHVLAMNINLPEARYRTATQRLQFFEQLELRVHSLPSVQTVAFANRMPMRGGWGGGVIVDMGEEASRDVDLQAVSTGYFETLGIQLMRGRKLTADDRAGHVNVAVVNQTFARELLPNSDPLGHRFRRSVQAPWITIVGIVNDTRRGGKTTAVTPQAYLPAAQTDIYPVRLADFAVRTAGDPHHLTSEIQRQVSAIDKDLPVTNVRTMDEIISTSVAERRFQTLLLTVFALVAVSLAVIGIFGVLSYAVSQRTAELGIRMAMGAQPKQIVALVLRQASFLIVTGILLGLLGAFAVTRYVQSLLFGVQPHDASTYVLAAALLAGVALAAAFIPARRGARIDPMRALRYE